MFKSFFEWSFISITIDCLLLGLFYIIILNDSQWFSAVIPGFCVSEKKKKKKSNKPKHRYHQGFCSKVL